MSQKTWLAICALVTFATVPMALPLRADASTFKTLYQFSGGSDGSRPESSVIEDAAGTLYGATNVGGTTNCRTRVGNPTFLGCGTLYSFNPSLGLKTLVLFNGPNGAFGDSSPVLIGATLYGSAYAGGSTDNGVLFSVHTDGTGFRLIHQFVGTDGSFPKGTLAVGPHHMLYGVTSAGGPTYPNKTASGVLFSLSASGVYTVLHSFSSGTGGGLPNTIAVEKSGLIIGTTFGGGNTGPLCGSYGCGILYSYNPIIPKFTVLHTFLNSVGQGANPVLGSTGPDGTVYGNATPFFSIGPKGFTFLPGNSQGVAIGSGAPIAPTLGLDGSLTTVEEQGPYTAGGTLTQQIDGIITVLHTFSGSDGGDPDAAPLLTRSGSFIGVGAGGGSSSCFCGTIWEYTP